MINGLFENTEILMSFLQVDPVFYTDDMKSFSLTVWTWKQTCHELYTVEPHNGDLGIMKITLL